MQISRSTLSAAILSRAVMMGADPFFLGLLVGICGATMLPLVRCGSSAAREYDAGLQAWMQREDDDVAEGPLSEVEAIVTRAIEALA